jgi:hypothetical protein
MIKTDMQKGMVAARKANLKRGGIGGLHSNQPDRQGNERRKHECKCKSVPQRSSPAPSLHAAHEPLAVVVDLDERAAAWGQEWSIVTAPGTSQPRAFGAELSPQKYDFLGN